MSKDGVTLSVKMFAVVFILVGIPLILEYTNNKKIFFNLFSTKLK